MNHIRGCSDLELALKYDLKLYDIQPEHIDDCDPVYGYRQIFVQYFLPLWDNTGGWTYKIDIAKHTADLKPIVDWNMDHTPGDHCDVPDAPIMRLNLGLFDGSMHTFQLNPDYS